MEGQLLVLVIIKPLWFQTELHDMWKKMVFILLQICN